MPRSDEEKARAVEAALKDHVLHWPERGWQTLLHPEAEEVSACGVQALGDRFVTDVKLVTCRRCRMTKSVRAP